MRGTGGLVAAVAAVLLLAGCSATPAASPSPHASSAPTATPTPTLAASACTWTGIRQPLDTGSLGRFAVELTNTSSGTCVLNGYPSATLSGGPRAPQAVPSGSAGGLPQTAVTVPAGGMAYAPVALATTTDGGITGHCSDSKHTTLTLTPPGSPSAVTIDVSQLHPCTPSLGFGWAIYPIQAAMPADAAFG